VSALVDTSVLIDYLRGHRGAAESLETERASAPLHGSEITRLEVLAGMRAAEEDETRSLLSTIWWHPVDAEVAEEAGSLGRLDEPTVLRDLGGHGAIGVVARGLGIGGSGASSLRGAPLEEEHGCLPALQRQRLAHGLGHLLILRAAQASTSGQDQRHPTPCYRQVLTGSG
jgi:hypothetical protein